MVCQNNNGAPRGSSLVLKVPVAFEEYQGDAELVVDGEKLAAATLLISDSFERYQWTYPASRDKDTDKTYGSAMPDLARKCASLRDPLVSVLLRNYSGPMGGIRPSDRNLTDDILAKSGSNRTHIFEAKERTLKGNFAGRAGYSPLSYEYVASDVQYWEKIGGNQFDREMRKCSATLSARL